MSDTTRSTTAASSTGVAGTTAVDETSDLIASNKVEGTAVYNGAGERLGTVHNFMVGKRSGKVAYAVMSFGGFLGIGESYHPLPWEVLTYDPAQGGYVVNLSREQLEGAPRYSASEAPDWTEPGYGRRIRDYYGVPVSTMGP
ncbi:MAG: PRC-barrel domain-containing protein [Geminicoccaceae bacterium]